MRSDWPDLLGYWRCLAVGGDIPLRARFDPVIGVPRSVGNLTLFGVENGEFRCRILGSEVLRRLPDMQGGSLTGVRLSDAAGIPSDIRQSAGDRFRRVVDIRRPALIRCAATFSNLIRWNALLLPLREPDGPVSALVLGVYFADGELPEGMFQSYEAHEDAAALQRAMTAETDARGASVNAD